MEELLFEFEAKSEGDQKLHGFLDNVKERFDNMDSFKKTFQKFQMSVEIALKKVAVLHVHNT